MNVEPSATETQNKSTNAQNTAELSETQAPDITIDDLSTNDNASLIVEPTTPTLSDIAALVARSTEHDAEPVRTKRAYRKRNKTIEAEEQTRPKDRSYRNKEADEPTPAVEILSLPSVHDAAAAMIVSSMDMVLAAISDGTYRAPDDFRENYKTAWADYLRTTGMTPPPWLMLTLMSVAYISPALSTPGGQTKWERLTNKFKSWWVGKFGS